MFSEEPAPAPPTMNSWVNRSAGVVIGAVTQRTQTRAGSDVAPSQLKRRGTASDVAAAPNPPPRLVRRDEPETAPAPGRRALRKIGGGDACRRRHVLDDDGGLAGDVLGEVSREEASGKIVVVGHGVSDDHSDLLVLVEIRRRLARSLAPRCPMGAERDAEDETNRGDRRVRNH